MENNKFYDKLNIKGLSTYIEKEVTLDYRRLIEHCDREIKSLESTNCILISNPPANISSYECKLMAENNKGRIVSFQQMREVILVRLRDIDEI